MKMLTPQEIISGSPAFPTPTRNSIGHTAGAYPFPDNGMTLRQYAAIKITAALSTDYESFHTNQAIVNRAVQLTDALLAELAK